METPEFINRKWQLVLGILIALMLVFYFAKPLVAQQVVGGRCEGCEAVLEYGDQSLRSVDTLPGFDQHANKMLIKGTVYQADGRTPAANVIIYAYHTNEKGIYPTRGDEKGWARRHGYIRGWVKTNAQGQYRFYTFKPASYPSRTEPAHVHLTVKEPGINEYWIDSIEFDDDPLVTSTHMQNKRNRAGSGIISLSSKNGLLLAQRDIYLGKNIPNYPH